MLYISYVFGINKLNGTVIINVSVEVTARREIKMGGRRFTEKEKQFRKRLRAGVCKARLARWFTDAGLSDSEKDVLYRYFLKKQSREQIAMDMYACRGTISRKITTGVNKLLDYFDYAQISVSDSTLK